MATRKKAIPKRPPPEKPRVAVVRGGRRITNVVAQATPAPKAPTLAELKRQAEAADRARALLAEELHRAHGQILDLLDTYMDDFDEAQRKAIRLRLRDWKAVGRGEGSHPPNKRLRDAKGTPFYWAGRGTHPLVLQAFEKSPKGKALIKAGEPLWEPI